jgi:pilus assembly protein CpaB
MKNKRRIIGIVAATLLAFIGTISLVGYVQSAKDKAVAEEALVDVYVMDEFVPKGAEPDTIKSSVSIEQVPARLKQPGAIADLEAVGDFVAATDLQPGDQLLAARLAARDLVFEEVTDKVQISARLEAERAVGGSLQQGDLVGVYLSFDPFNYDEGGRDQESADSIDPAAIAGSTEDASTDEASTEDISAEDASTEDQRKTPNVSRLEFQHVLVTNVQTVDTPVSPDDGDEQANIEQVTGRQYVVTLALSPEQSERFVFATEFGHVWLSLDPASVADDGTRLVTLGNVYTVVTK